ncbi:MAG: SDR family oxidoreductase [Patescibacteria group bacterium]|nr:SDR family oxidoreductase [Patescibacteria group bacterium]MDE1941411.1 SDR family oxidoreductase [Patescibacteria group bacterium]MDE1966807.1 SDR family oxidoreductase [Patescibacteria group bacterium]
MNSLKGKKIVVTGGAGFIGSHIVDALLEAGSEVVVVDDLSTGRMENIAHVSERIRFEKLSIVDTDKMALVLKGAYAVCHQAALPSVPKSIAKPMETHEANSTGTLSVFTAAVKAGVGRVVYASSSSVYGDTPTLPKIETMPTKPLSPYAAQKLMGELYGRIFFSLHGLETIGLRYFNVFGPRQNPDSEYAAVIPKFIKLMKHGERPSIYGDGEQTRDFTYVTNVVDANLCALRAANGFGDAFNIASGGQISLLGLVRSLNSILGTSIEPKLGEARRGDIKDSFADIRKAEKVLGYEPKTAFEEGLRLTADAIR